jgi:tRNA pseudouridine38-40 synthase
MRIALGLEYDGSAFCGWQTQPSGCGIQDHLQASLASIAGHPLDVVAAGRTDTGVHATAQVVHFDTLAERDDNAWVRGTNTGLDPALRVLWSHRVPNDFHARYSARSRTYRYILVNEPVAPAVLRQRVGWYHRPLELDPMREAAQRLVGEHDFSAFRDAQCQAKSPVRNLTECSVERSGTYFTFTFRANAFLHHMIRNIVGSLVYVGAGKHPPGWIDELMKSRDRRNAAPTFMPDGLYLAGIEYDPGFGLKSHELTYPHQDLRPSRS